MIAPRVMMNMSISRALTPLATRRSTLSASATPARNTNVGAQMCVIHRVKNSAAGSAIVADPAYIAESSERCPPSKAIDAWSTIIRIMTRPRIQSIAAMRLVGRQGFVTACGCRGESRTHSYRLQPGGAEHPAHRVDQFNAGRNNVGERVRQAELRPFRLAHLVERQHVDALDISQVRRERGDSRDVVEVVGSRRAPGRSAARWAAFAPRGAARIPALGPTSMPVSWRCRSGSHVLMSSSTRSIVSSSSSLSRSP